MREGALVRGGWIAGALALSMLSAGCATTKVVGQNIERVAHKQPIDGKQMGRALDKAVVSDTHRMEVSLGQLQREFVAAVAKLRANVARRWGQRNARVASRTVYVKYTQGYQTRVVTDFDHGLITIETVDQRAPRDSLRTAIVAALLTPNDPAAVDVFSDKDVVLEPGQTPYLFGLVHDDHGRSIRTREQASAYAQYLVDHRLQVRTLTTDQSHATARYVRLAMVRNFEAIGARRYQAAVTKYATQYNVSPSLVLAIMRTESNFNPFAVSGAPAYGLMQLVPSTGGRAALQRVSGVDETPTADYLFDPDHNIQLGAAYLGLLSHDQFQSISNPISRDYCVIAAYNGGAGSVTRAFGGNRGSALVTINSLGPPELYERLRTHLPSAETRQYLVKVTDYRRDFVTVTPPAPIAVSAAGAL
jgi:membrane-bound lytic murein transglycosylase C